MLSTQLSPGPEPGPSVQNHTRAVDGSGYGPSLTTYAHSLVTLPTARSSESAGGQSDVILTRGCSWRKFATVTRVLFNVNPLFWEAVPVGAPLTLTFGFEKLSERAVPVAPDGHA